MNYVDLILDQQTWLMEASLHFSHVRPGTTKAKVQVQSVILEVTLNHKQMGILNLWLLSSLHQVSHTASILRL